MIGQVISHYQILEKLGAGGMGVVYKAHDTKLDRTVALKFLPSHLSGSPDDKARFVQEAKAAAALNHPNVCSIIDILEENSQMFIVMEYVDGQTLREKREQVRFKEAIDIGIQVAEGLAAAHEKGIVHRDIKPENIMIRKDGIAQIMDFGLAKLRSASSKVNRLTKEGSTLGTAGYMSPEQVLGHDADHRSDIFSYGVLLYELLAGQLPFKGVHETALAYEIVNVDPVPMSAVRPEIDPNLDAIVLECLEKEPRERAQSIAQVALDLKRFRRESGHLRASRITAARPIVQPIEVTAAGSALRRTSTARQRLPWMVSAAALLAAIVLAFFYFRQPQVETRSVRSSILPPDNLTFAAASGSAGEGHLALAPDGSMLAFVATDSMGKTRLMVRPLNSFSAKELPATEGAYYPFWSPDNRFIGYFQNGKLKKIEAAGGPSVTLCDASDARGGTWNNGGIIVFAPSAFEALYQVSASGGTPAQLTKLDSSLHQRTHRWPSFLPDGKHFLYFGRSSFGGVEREEDGLYVGSLDGKQGKRLSMGKSNAVYSSGFLLYLREKTLMAQRFDPGKLEFSGEATPVAEPVEYDLGYNRAVFSASENGMVVYQPSVTQNGSQLEWFDRRGNPLGTIGEQGEYADASLSPDGKSMVFDLYDSQSKNRDIWVYEFARKIKTRFTFDANVDELPCWSPDGSHILFHSDRKGHYDLYQKRTSGAGVEEIILESEIQKFPNSWTPDGKYIIYNNLDPKTGYDLFLLPVEKSAGNEERKPVMYLQTGFNEQFGVCSPDMRWIAYESDESGAYELYVRPFYDSSGNLVNNTSGKWQLSSTGINLNTSPRWSRDGKQIYYQSADNKLISVGYTVQGSTFSVGNLETLLEIKTKGVSLFQDVTADGEKFLFVTAVGGGTSEPVALITNWDVGLKH